MVVSEGTRKKLENLGIELRDEFAHVPAGRIEETLATITDDLLARARFDDFVPLLVHRAARERLRLPPEEMEDATARG